jgi:acetate kinase
MGFSTLAGLVMGSRCGDLDPGAVLYLQTTMGFSHADVQALLYRRSGLLGMSGMTSDMRELLARKSETAAQEAIDLFCYRARHYLAALTAALGGLDRLVFTGGIGANAPEIRETICAGLGYLGIALNDGANHAGKAIISEDDSSVVVQTLVSNEELMIARHVHQLARCSETLDR